MIQVINKEFFTLRSNTQTWFDDNEKPYVYTLFNVMAEPQCIDLKKAKKTPFTSIITKSTSAKYVSDGKAFALLQNNEFRKVSLYEDDEYLKYANIFSLSTNDVFEKDPLHNLLYVNDRLVELTTPITKPKQVMALIAMPVHGIVAPIKKSANFNLYNAAFISCKPFQWNGECYNKLVYLMVDIVSFFSFQEYLKIDAGRTGLVFNHNFGLNDEGKIQMQTNVFEVPCEGRDHMFTPNPDKNLFFLSDIPSDVIVNSNAISAEMKS